MENNEKKVTEWDNEFTAPELDVFQYEIQNLVRITFYEKQTGQLFLSQAQRWLKQQIRILYPIPDNQNQFL